MLFATYKGHNAIPYSYGTPMGYNATMILYDQYYATMDIADKCRNAIRCFRASRGGAERFKGS